MLRSRADSAGAEVAAEPFVQRLQRPHLLLADALGTFEVVGRDLLARAADRRRRRRGRSRPRPTARCLPAAIALSRLSTSAWLRTSPLIDPSSVMAPSDTAVGRSDSTPAPVRRRRPRTCSWSIPCRPQGPRAWNLSVLMPISAPRPNSPPSLNRVLALIITAELSTAAANSPGRGQVAGHDRVGVLRAVAVDVLDRLVERVDHLDRDDRAEVLGRSSPLRSPASASGTQLAGPLVAADLDAPLAQGLGRSAAGTSAATSAWTSSDSAALQTPSRWHLELTVSRSAISRSADAVDVDVAVAGEVLDHRHRGLFGHAANQPSPPRGMATSMYSGQLQRSGPRPRGRWWRPVARRRRQAALAAASVSRSTRAAAGVGRFLAPAGSRRCRS